MDNLDKAIKLFERITNMKVNSIRLEHSSPCHESYVINFEYLLHLAPAENDSILEALSRLHQAPTIKTSFYPLRRYNLYKKYSAEKLPAGFEKRILISAERILEQEGKVPCLNRLKKENI